MEFSQWCLTPSVDILVIRPPGVDNDEWKIILYWSRILGVCVE